MALADKYKGTIPPQRKTPVWEGPEKSGVTFSLLSRFLVCRERFRLHVIEGLVPSRGFNPKIEFGSMWHVCEEVHAKGIDPLHREPRYEGAKELTSGCLLAYCQGISSRWKESAEQINHWYNIAKMMWPLYLNHWKRSPDVKGRENLLSEEVFNVPYHLPSGRTVTLRGKWDSVDLISQAKTKGIYLQENKTKGMIDEDRIQRQLNFDLQTMLYLVAFQTWQSLDDYGQPIRFPEAVNFPIRGVRYNVVRRPMHRQKKTESPRDFYLRLEEEVKDDPGHFFMRWKVEVTQGDVERFKKECLNPILEQLCDWWEWVKYEGNPFVSEGKNDPQNKHWRHPFGVYNILDEGGSSDLDYYLATGNETGLIRLDRGEELFPELEQ